MLATVGLRVAQVRVIFTLPPQLCIPGINHPRVLAYVEWFNPFQVKDACTQLWTVSRSFRRGGVRDSEIIPLDYIVQSCHLVPKFGKRASPEYTQDNVLETCRVFLLNCWIDLWFYCMIRVYNQI